MENEMAKYPIFMIMNAIDYGNIEVVAL